MPTDLRAGHATHWMRFGTGQRPALLLHCSLAHCGVLQGLARELAADFQMTAFDLPGHGRSADWDGISNYQSLSIQIAGNFITDPIDVIGHFFGATVALRLAVEQPEKSVLSNLDRAGVFCGRRPRCACEFGGGTTV